MHLFAMYVHYYIRFINAKAVWLGWWHGLALILATYSLIPYH